MMGHPPTVRTRVTEARTGRTWLGRTVLAAAGLGAAIVLTGCSATTETAATDTATTGASSSHTSGIDSGGAGTGDAAQQLLTRHGLAGQDTRALIARLEASQQDRSDGPVGSVRATDLVLSDDRGQAVLPLPEGEFYLSIAPYLTRTHDCFNHNLATCQGELTDAAMTVRVTGADGKELVNQSVTTGSNGFAGLWLPRDVKATLSVDYQGKRASQSIGTGPQDPTCLTTLRLT